MGESLAVWDGDETGSGEGGECISSGYLSPAFKSFFVGRVQNLYIFFKKSMQSFFDASDIKLDLGPLIYADRCVPLSFSLISARSGGCIKCGRNYR